MKRMRSIAPGKDDFTGFRYIKTKLIIKTLELEFRKCFKLKSCEIISD